MLSVKKQLVGIAGLLLVLVFVNFGIILYRVAQQQFDARVVNSAGVVRGAAQRWAKLMLAADLAESGTPAAADEAADLVDRYLDGLLDGSSEHRLPAASSGDFRNAMVETRTFWRSQLKSATPASLRDAVARQALLEKSEQLFELSNAAVNAAERATMSRLSTTRSILIVLSVLNLFIVLAIGYSSRTMTLSLNRTISTLASTTKQMATTAELQERVAAEQAAATNQTTTTIEALGDSSRLSAQQSENTARETSQSLASAHQGVETVQKTLQAMAEMKENVGGLAREILSLSEQIDQIGEISTFVGDLANQTNMLALNAAVEAAHAGEHGKGFAVVASEIRKLADQSTKSVSRINVLVTDIQQATNNSVMATEQGTKVVNHGMALADQTAEVFDALAASISRASESIQQISLNTREQSAGINQVVEAIESLNEGARESASGLKRTSDDLQTLNNVVLDLQSTLGISDVHPG